jgi:hypothetical protein
LLAELFRSAEEQDEPDDKVRHGLELLRDAPRRIPATGSSTSF